MPRVKKSKINLLAIYIIILDFIIHLNVMTEGKMFIFIQEDNKII